MSKPVWKIVAGSVVLAGTVGSSAEAAISPMSAGSDPSQPNSVQIRALTPRTTVAIDPESDVVAVLPENLAPLDSASSIPSVPSVPSVVSVPSVPSVPSVVSVPSVPSEPSVVSVPSVPSVPSVQSVESVPSPISSD